MGKAIVIKDANFSQVAVATIDIIAVVPTIRITIAGRVTINSEDDAYYTTDGSTPTNQSTKYTGIFTVTQGTTVKAIAYNGANYSDVVSAVYDGTLQAPTISISTKGVATITASEDAEHIYYTTDDSRPTTSSTEYTEPIIGLENGQVVKAIATADSGNIVSDVTSETAVVIEGPTFGKKFAATTSGIPSGALSDDATRFVSPKIPISANASFSWVYKNATYTVDFIVEYTSDNTRNEYWNIDDRKTSGSINKTAKAGTTYLRFSGLIGAAQAGMKVTSGGVTLWEYDGSTE